MDIKSLKDKILQLAIQGKLVPQNENDEPAKVLLERIKEEKEQLIKDKVIKKEKPLPEISEEEKLFDLPKGWEWCRLGNITQFLGGYAFKSNRYVQYSNNQIIRLGNVKNGYLILDDKQVYISDEDAQLTNQYKINKDDILLTMTGTKGKRDYFFTCIVNDSHIENSNLYLNQRVGCLRSYNNIIARYLNYILKSEICLENIFKFETGTANQGNLGAEAIKKLIIPIPPLKEQKRIADKVDELFELIDELENNKQDLLENISYTKNKVLQLAIQGKLVEQCEDDEPASLLLEKIKVEKEQLIKDKVIKKEKPLPEIIEEEKPFDLPKGWQWSKLGIISRKIHYGYTASAQDNNTGVKLLRITDIQNNKVNWNTVPFCSIEKNKLDTCMLITNDILIARTGGTIGKSFIVKNVDCISVFASYLIRVQTLSNVSADYIKLFLESELYWTQIEEKSKGTGQSNVNAVSLSNLIIPLPPLEEQKRIVAKVDLIMDYLDKLQQEIESQEIILDHIVQ